MKKKEITLRIDTSREREVVISLWKHDVLIKEMMKKQDHSSEVTLPLIMEILKQHNMTFENIKKITVYPGPGSYTGIRVGAAIGMTLGNLLGIPVNDADSQNFIKLCYGDDRWSS